MFGAKIIIPKMSNNRKIYIYRAKNADSINTIAKVKELNPVIVIDEALANTTMINGNPCYEVIDNPSYSQNGITYNGPIPNIVPLTEYETNVKVCPINNYTYVNAVHFNKLDINQFSGTMFYYTAIGVDEVNEVITHLSKVNGIMIEYEYNIGTRHIHACDDYNNDNNDVWNYISSCPWDEELIIGDINDPINYSKYGNPFCDTLKSIDKDKINVSLRPVITQNFSVLEVQNPWQKNNKEYNFRKLKSFKIRNVQGQQYGDFSEPTFQSLLPVSLEKMVILRKIDDISPNDPSPLEGYPDDTEVYTIIRRDGLYYNAKEHKKLGLNKYNIPLGETTAIFSEASVNDTINIQMQTLVAHVYTYTFYLIDVYGNISEPTVVTITT